MIYFDNAATTLKKPDSVPKAVLEAFGKLGNAGRGVNEASLDAARSIFSVREAAAELFGAERAQQIAFTANVTEALNMAILGLIEPGDHLVTTAADHNSVLRPSRMAADNGARLSIVSCDPQGRIDYGMMEKLVKPDIKAVVCTHASNVIGNRYDIRRIADIAHKNGALFILDAAQTAGSVPINVKEIGIDVLCFTGHKSLYGPQGTGGIYVRPGLELRPILSGGTGVQSYDPHQPREMPTLLESGTLNGPGIAGLGAGLEFVKKQTENGIARRVETLTARFLEGVRAIPGITLYGDFEGERVGVVSLNVGTFDAGAVSDALFANYEIATRAGAHCAPLMHKALGTDRRGTVRFSFSFFNTEDEVDEAVRALKELSGM